jgi:threonine dehydrogenase-like Zn-dependent dehydrogenase
MADTMRAFVYMGNKQVGIVEKPIPEPGAHDAVVKTTMASICISDPHAVDAGLLDMFGRAGATLGHEGLGIVHRLGSEVKGLKEGDRVLVSATTPCWRCENCLRGYSAHCGGHHSGGFKFTTQLDGTIADYFRVTEAEANLARIPEEVPDDAALFASETMPVGFKGAEEANIPLGGTVAVFAQGPIGLMATAAARLLGAGLVIAVESDPKRQSLAKSFGADVVIDFTKSDPVEEIIRLTGDGVDSAVEALGTQGTFESCVKVTRPGGTVSIVGWFTDDDYIKIPRVAFGLGIGDKKIVGSFAPGGAELMTRLLRLIQNGRVDPRPLGTHRFAFEEAAVAWSMLAAKEDGIIKPVIAF